MKQVVSLMVLALLTGACSVFPKPEPHSAAERLKQFEGRAGGVEKSVRIFWDKHHIPFIEAQTDRDCAFTLGLVHAHLRLGQITLIQRLTQGRIAETVGPLAAPLDHALRLLDLGRSVDGTLASMPQKHRAWLNAFVDGFNHYAAQSGMPPELAALGIEFEPMTPKTLLTGARIAGADVNWGVFIRLLSARDASDFDTMWKRTLEVGMGSTPSFASFAPKARPFVELIWGLSRSGSNSLALSPQRTKSTSAIMMNDPHLGMSIPNFWLLAGYKSPSYHVVGMMVPGLPFVALGRNPTLSWGGTNMRTLSSDLYDVTATPKETRTVPLDIRWWPDRTLELRDSSHGPVLSDLSIFPGREGEDLALRWVGHEVTDELSAFLRANRATSVFEFRDAFETYGVSGQSMLVADIEGNIAQVLAAWIPKRSYRKPPSFILNPMDPQHQWQGFYNSTTLPFALNPSEGFLASANNLPSDKGPLINVFYNDPERINRLKSLAMELEGADLGALNGLQRDVYSGASDRLNQTWLRVIGELNMAGVEPEVQQSLRGWDAHYRIDDSAPVYFETLTAAIWDFFHDDADGAKRYYQDWNYTHRYLPQALQSLTPTDRRSLLEEALKSAAEAGEEYPTWGDLHRIVIRHPIGNVPWFGSDYTFDSLPAMGSRDTLFKTNHGLKRGPGGTRYGTQSRHISIMDDLDHNFFVLLGGQDGWVGSETALDQVDLWYRGEMIQVPLRVDQLVEFGWRPMFLGPKASD